MAGRPSHYPVGAQSALHPYELAVVRDVLAECEGVVRWGGAAKKAVEDATSAGMTLARARNRKSEWWAAGDSNPEPKD